MISRLFNRPINNSFFLFGPRGSGKSSLLRKLFFEKVLWIDLLDPETEDRYALHPSSLKDEILKVKKEINWVVLDEIQKVPRLLDVVHQMIESDAIKFALTGSSARKLKKGSANLLAGRAFVKYLFPLTHLEMGSQFDLLSALQWGTLPKITQLESDQDKADFLRSYALTYLKEEIWGEQIIRKLDPFRKFLAISAQMNGEVINSTNIARDVGVDTKTIQSYYQILEDTLVGFFLEPYHRSVRKQQRQAPKFFWFDSGVKRSLEGLLTQFLIPKTYGFGKAFEHFVILEMFRLNAYFQKDYRFSYLMTKDNAEIDLIIERPGLPAALVEIKSSDRVDDRDTATLERFLPDFKKAEAFCLSLDPNPKKIKSVSAVIWSEGIKELGLVE